MLQLESTDGLILLLQSGGRDSAIAGARLLAASHRVHAVTFVVDSRQTLNPRRRALEIRQLSPNYSWAAVNYRAWEEGLTSAVKQRIATRLPQSCLLCAMAKVTAAIVLCRNLRARRIAVGYSGYQAAWAEQTPAAVILQRAALAERGIEFLTPTLDIASKEEAQRGLQEHRLTVESLENACCVSKIGTQPVGESLIEDVIRLSFEFADLNEPHLEVIERLGDN